MSQLFTTLQQAGFGFAALLLTLSILTGSVWLLDRYVLAPKRAAARAAGVTVTPSAFVDFCQSLFPVIFAVFIVRAFVVEPFQIPSGSMIPTLHVGDFILVNKFGYGLRCPVGRCKLVDVGEPARGDVVVFVYPGPDRSDPHYRTDFIKRVVGLPGDRIRYANKQLTVNGELAAQSPATTQADASYGDLRVHENFGGVEHDILFKPERSMAGYECPFVQPNGDNFEYVVPPGNYFMMGDNRDGSNDSRCWGTVPEANLKGRAMVIWMSWKNFRPQFARFGTTIR